MHCDGNWLKIINISSESSAKTVPVLTVLFLGNPCCKSWFCHRLLILNWLSIFRRERSNKELLFDLYFLPELNLFFCPFFSQMGSRRAGTGLCVGRANELCILVFLSWIGTTLLWAFCSGGSSVHGENRNFPQQIDVGAELQNPLFFHLSQNPLEWGLVLTSPFPLFLILAFLCIALEGLYIGPSLYPDMVQECFPSEVSISNEKEEGIAIWRPCLSRIKLTQKYAFYEGIKISPLNIFFV